MRRRFRVAWSIAGLAVLGAMSIGGPGEVRAGTIGITISGGISPGGGDPPYRYIFDVFLDPGFEVDELDFFKIDQLVGVTSGSLHSEPPSNLPTYGWLGDPGDESITWAFVGNTAIPNSNPVGSNMEVPLGEFVVQTTQDFPNAPPVPPGTKIPYSFSIHHLNDGTATGSGIIILGVPEPSSFVLLALGFAALLALATRRKRCRLARAA
jgi:hypothetical protein